MVKPIQEGSVKQTNAANPGESLYENKYLAGFAAIDESGSKGWLLQFVYIVLAICVPVVIFLVILWFSKSLQINPQTGVSILIRIFGVITASVLLVKTHLSNIWGVIPLFLYRTLLSLYPAFDYWLYGD